MALTKCKECGHDVSTTASACPHCGAPDFLSDDGKELLRKERQKEQLRELVEKGGTGGVSLKHKEKKPKKSPKVRTKRITLSNRLAESNINKGIGIGCGLVIGVIVALIVISLLGFSMCGYILSSSSDTKTEEAEKIEAQAYISKVKILKNELRKHQYSGDWEVTGSIKNMGNRTLEAVKMMVYLLDNDGKRIGEKINFPVKYSGIFSSGSDNLLKPGDVVDFSCTLDKLPASWARKVELGIIDTKFY